MLQMSRCADLWDLNSIQITWSGQPYMSTAAEMFPGCPGQGSHFMKQWLLFAHARLFVSLLTPKRIHAALQRSLLASFSSLIYFPSTLQSARRQYNWCVLFQSDARYINLMTVTKHDGLGKGFRVPQTPDYWMLPKMFWTAYINSSNYKYTTNPLIVSF